MKKLLYALPLVILLSCAPPLSKATGDIRYASPSYPRTLNYLNGGDAYTGRVAGKVFESLLSRDEANYEIIGHLAESWEIIEDGRVFEFKLNENIHFSDGTPMTAEDVRFTFEDIIYNEDYPLVLGYRSFLGEMDAIEVLDTFRIRIAMKTPHFLNFEKLGSVYIHPEHFYGDPEKDFNKDFENVMLGSGAYTVQGDPDRTTLVLSRDTNYWGDGSGAPEWFKDYYLFSNIIIESVQSDQVELEMYKKRSLDFMLFSAEIYPAWDDKDSYPWTDPKNVRMEVENTIPRSWGGVALNMREGVLKDKAFRQALQYLFDREFIANKVYNGHKVPIASPFSVGSPYSAKLKPRLYNPDKAVELLASLGFKQVGDDGILYREKGSKKERASIKLMHSHEAHNEWAEIFKENAKEYGVELTIEQRDWTTATKMLQDFNFEAFVIGWSGGFIPSPEQLYSGKDANTKGSDNLPGIDHRRLNRLIAKAPTEFDEAKRISMFHEMEKILFEEQPYLWRFREKSYKMAYWKDLLWVPDPAYLEYTWAAGNMLDRWGPMSMNEQ